MGLPGSGKTTLASELASLINAERVNADEVRKAAADWDFSEAGRKRQAKRMADLAKELKRKEFVHVSNTRRLSARIHFFSFAGCKGTLVVSLFICESSISQDIKHKR